MIAGSSELEKKVWWSYHTVGTCQVTVCRETRGNKRKYFLKTVKLNRTIMIASMIVEAMPCECMLVNNNTAT